MRTANLSDRNRLHRACHRSCPDDCRIVLRFNHLQTQQRRGHPTTGTLRHAGAHHLLHPRNDEQLSGYRQTIFAVLGTVCTDYRAQQ